MTVAINMLDAHGNHITTINLYNDTYEHLATEAAINGVDIATHITEIVTGHAHDILNSLNGDDT